MLHQLLTGPRRVPRSSIFVPIVEVLSTGPHVRQINLLLSAVIIAVEALVLTIVIYIIDGPARGATLP